VLSFGGGDHREQGVGEHGQQRPSPRGQPAADLVFVQAGQALPGVEILTVPELPYPAAVTGSRATVGAGVALSSREKREPEALAAGPSVGPGRIEHATLAQSGDVGGWKYTEEVALLRNRLVALDVGERQKDFFRWYTLRLDRFELFAKRHRLLYLRLRIPTLAASAAVPALIAANVNPIGRTIAIILSVFVAAATGIETLLAAGRRWRHFREAVELLKTEGWLYIGLAGPYQRYPTHDAAYSSFAAAVGSALRQEVQEYGSTFVRGELADARQPPQDAQTMRTDAAIDQ
jgi:hypothetical protein